MARSLMATIELKVPATSLWDILKKPEIIPKLMPQAVSSYEYIEGDGGVGSIRLMKFGPAMANLGTFSKQKIEMLDEEGKRFSYSVIDGEVLAKCKAYKTSVDVVQGDKEQSCTVISKIEYEPINPDMAPPEAANQAAITVVKALEAYILNPTLENTN